MTVEIHIDTVIEVVKPIALIAVGMVTEAIRRWFNAPKKERTEFIDVATDAIDDGRITLQEGIAIYKEGEDVFIGFDLGTTDDYTVGKL